MRQVHQEEHNGARFVTSDEWLMWVLHCRKQRLNTMLSAGARMRFKDRTDAGRQLATRLGAYRKRPDVLVLALPRGGVPVAKEVADRLGAPLDVFLVRKLGVPGQEELAMGAVASGGVRIFNEEVVEYFGLSWPVIEEVTARERCEIERRERRYRPGLDPIDPRGKTVLLVDDGLATGSTMLAAVEALRKLGPANIVVAVPVAPPAMARKLASHADEVVCVLTVEPFDAVGGFYEDFFQTTDEEVCAILEDARAPCPAPGLSS